MRRLLYITPFFPPQSRVGALRPLKFVRHLPSLGWDPVVLCDLWPSAETDEALVRLVPEQVTVYRDYSRRARQAEQRRLAAASGPGATRHERPRKAAWEPPERFNPEIFPLKAHARHMPHALCAARRVLARHPCEAVLVNADPWAALVVGAVLARQTGLPLVADLRDPWSLCSLRRPLMPRPTRWIVDALERFVARTASTVILNTDTACRAYAVRYADLGSDRFAVIRNHSDEQLIGEGRHPGFDRFTLLFLGRFRRFVDGAPLFGLLAELRRRGVAAADLQLVVTGGCEFEQGTVASRLGVDSMVRHQPFVPYRQIGAAMAAADVLTLVNAPTDQRIMAKFYDYALSARPILAFAENAEFSALMARIGGGAVFGYGEVAAAADYVQRLMRGGRHPTVTRLGSLADSRTATVQLVAILERAVSSGPVRRAGAPATR
ncbi:MAG TPA: hypothetical protein PLE61_13340 [Vicinamibacterales bacterium]|nr:hypothetical protein [Vicinamibacterales bacterium]